MEGKSPAVVLTALTLLVGLPLVLVLLIAITMATEEEEQASATSCAVTAVPAGGSATTSEIRYVPAVSPTRTIPTSIARPPAVVTTSACSPAARPARRVGSWPMSR